VIDPPVTRYADCAGVSIAYQVLGKGGLDLVLVPGGVSHVDITWQDRRYQRMMERLTSFARVIVFDKRGMGASDPVSQAPTLEERRDDIQAVMDAVGIEQAALFGLSEAVRRRHSSPPRSRSGRARSCCAGRFREAPPSPIPSPTIRPTPCEDSGWMSSSPGRHAWDRE
jgi:hypothetical protein